MHGIAAELHDSLGQRLVIMKNHAIVLLQNRKGTGILNIAQRESIEEMSAELSGALREVKEISYDLRPYRLDRLGLSAAVRALVEKAAAASETVFHAEIDDIDDVCPKGDEINFYRIVQECVNNILKHSHAANAYVDIKRDREAVHLTVHDDGDGIASALIHPTSTTRGFGLTGIAERADLIGGRATIKSTPELGTTITVDFQFRRPK